MATTGQAPLPRIYDFDVFRRRNTTFSCLRTVIRIPGTRWAMVDWKLSTIIWYFDDSNVTLFRDTCHKSLVLRHLPNALELWALSRNCVSDSLTLNVCKCPGCFRLVRVLDTIPVNVYWIVFWFNFILCNMATNDKTDFWLLTLTMQHWLTLRPVKSPVSRRTWLNHHRVENGV